MTTPEDVATTGPGRAAVEPRGGLEHVAGAAPGATALDPEALRAAGDEAVAAARADVEQAQVRLAQAVAHRADVEQEAQRIEAQRAEDAKLGQYLLAVQEAEHALAHAVAAHSASRVALEAAEQRLAHHQARQREAVVTVDAERRRLDQLLADEADLEAIGEARLHVAQVEATVPLLAQPVEQARAALVAAQEDLERRTEAVRQCWTTLERLEATAGLERPEVVPPRPKTWAEMSDDERFAAFAGAYQRVVREQNSPAMRTYREARERQRLDRLTRRAMAAVFGQ